MNNKMRGGLLLVIGLMLIVLGITAAYLLTRKGGVLSSLTVRPTQVNVVTNKAVVVTHDMKLGDLVKAEDVKAIDVPVEISPRDTLTDPNAAVGKFIKSDLVQGEMLLQHNLADPTNVNRDLAFTLGEDHVMMAISSDDVMTKESILQRGDIVDILATITEQVSNVVTEQNAATPSPDTTNPQNPQEKVSRSFTFDAFQKTNISAMVMDVIVDKSQNNQNQTTNPNEAPRGRIVVKAYLLALSPQDALVLKHLKDGGAVFDFVLRSPTSTQLFDLIPVTEEYIVELYGLQIIK